MTTTVDALATILARDHELAPERLTADAVLDELGIDSLATIELLWNVEDAFDIALPTDSPTDLVTLGEVARYVDELVAAQAADPA